MHQIRQNISAPIPKSHLSLNFPPPLKRWWETTASWGAFFQRETCFKPGCLSNCEAVDGASTICPIKELKRLKCRSVLFQYPYREKLICPALSGTLMLLNHLIT